MPYDLPGIGTSVPINGYFQQVGRRPGLATRPQGVSDNQLLQQLSGMGQGAPMGQNVPMSAGSGEMGARAPMIPSPAPSSTYGGNVRSGAVGGASVLANALQGGGPPPVPENVAQTLAYNGRNPDNAVMALRGANGAFISPYSPYAPRNPLNMQQMGPSMMGPAASVVGGAASAMSGGE